MKIEKSITHFRPSYTLRIFVEFTQSDDYPAWGAEVRVVGRGGRHDEPVIEVDSRGYGIPLKYVPQVAEAIMKAAEAWKVWEAAGFPADYGARALDTALIGRHAKGESLSHAVRTRARQKRMAARTD